MSTQELQQRTAVNIQEKANLIWAIADKLVGTYKPHEYGQVILPLCVIKRFNDCLKATHDDVVAENEALGDMDPEMKDGFLCEKSGYDFYNTSKFTFDSLLADSDNIGDNFKSYLQNFSANVIDIIKNFNFEREIDKLDDNGILFNVIQEFCTPKAYMGVDAISAVDMGYIFEELVRKFSESYDEQAGAHFTARDIIYLMVAILIAPRRAEIAKNGITASIYDMTMGTSQMLDCMSEKLKEIDPNAVLTEFGQELNDLTFAIAKSNALIKGQDANNMKLGNTLSNDLLPYQFDYIISNPPFGIEWKNEKAAVEKEHKEGESGRFAPGLPSIGDSQQLFVLNGCFKLKENGRMAIIQNGSPLFKGDAGSGESNIRGYLLENDWLEAIVQMPTDMFYNTGIATYIWIITKEKSADRIGKVQLLDASNCSVKRRKSLGSKRNEFSDECVALIEKAYMQNADYVIEDGDLKVESKVFDNDYFKYSKLTIERPLVDEETGEPILKKGKMQPDAKKRDTEIVPWKENVDEYMKKNVLPYAPDAWIDKKKTKIGYEIPFTREFYKYVAPRKSEDIFNHLKELESKETELMNKILG